MFVLQQYSHTSPEQSPPNKHSAWVQTRSTHALRTVLPKSREELLRFAAEAEWAYYVSAIIFNLNDPGEVAFTDVLRSQRIIKNPMSSDERRTWSFDQGLLLEPTLAYCRHRCVFMRTPQFSKTLLTIARQSFEQFATDHDA